MEPLPSGTTGLRDALEALVRDGDRIVVATGAGEPAGLIEAFLEGPARTRRDLEVVQVMPGSRGRLLEAAALGQRVLLPVAGGPLPEAGRERVEVLGLSMMQLHTLVGGGGLRVDGLLFAGRQRGEAVTAGLAVDLVPAAFERARFRAVELNGHLPEVASTPLLALSRVDLVAAGDREPPEVPAREPDEAGRRIGEAVAELLPRHAALELGLGSTLSGVAGALAAAGHRVAVHSGLVSDWARELVEAGVADRPLDCCEGRPVAGAVAMGSRGFYRWLDGSEHVRLDGSGHLHDPAHLAGLDGFTAVNAAAQVDCSGAVGVPRERAATAGGGGLLDFAVAGAYHGRSVVALRSLDRAGRSRVVPRLGAVQLPAALVTHVVTEHGAAHLHGRTWRERQRALLAVAHPDHRQALRRALARPGDHPRATEDA